MEIAPLAIADPITKMPKWPTSGNTYWHYVKQERIAKFVNVLKGMFYSHFGNEVRNGSMGQFPFNVMGF